MVNDLTPVSQEGPGGAIFPRKFGPGGQIFGGAKFPVTPAEPSYLNINSCSG